MGITVLTFTENQEDLRSPDLPHSTASTFQVSSLTLTFHSQWEIKISALSHFTREGCAFLLPKLKERLLCISTTSTGKKDNQYALSVYNFLSGNTEKQRLLYYYFVLFSVLPQGIHTGNLQLDK